MAPRPKNDMYRMVAEYAAMPFTLAACMFIGWAVGYGLDRLFGTSFLYLVFLILGIAAGIIQVIRQVQRDTNAPGS